MAKVSDRVDLNRMIQIENLVRIGSDSFGLMPRIKSDQVGFIIDRFSSNLKNKFAFVKIHFRLQFQKE